MKKIKYEIFIKRKAYKKIFRLGIKKFIYIS